MFNLQDFGKTIRQLRKKQHSRILDVAEEMNLSESHLGAIERGIAKPSIEVIVLIANYWKISLENFAPLQTNIDVEQTFYNDFTDLDYQFLYEILLNHISAKNGGDENI